MRLYSNAKEKFHARSNVVDPPDVHFETSEKIATSLRLRPNHSGVTRTARVGKRGNGTGPMLQCPTWVSLAVVGWRRGNCSIH